MQHNNNVRMFIQATPSLYKNKGLQEWIIWDVKSNIPSSAENFKFQTDTRDSVSEILRSLNKSSLVGFNNIPPKLPLLGAAIISGPLFA